MYESDPFLLGDPDYLQGLQTIVAALKAEFLAAQYHPEGGAPDARGEVKDGSFIHGAVFSVGRLGAGRTLSLDRSEIRACRDGLSSEVQRKLDAFVSDMKAFRLVWTSQNEAVEIECGRYASIPDASDDIPAAKARLEARFPATVDFHYPHDIAAGTWRAVGLEAPSLPQRGARGAGAMVNARVGTDKSRQFGELYYSWAKEQLGPNAIIIYPPMRSDTEGDVYCNFDGRFLDVLRERGVPFEVM